MYKIYIALIRTDGTEPDPASGYERIYAGEYDIISKPALFGGRQIVFPDVKAPGYGVISSMAACTENTGGKYLSAWDFPQAVDLHEGVVPVIQNGTLYRGMEVQARVVMNSADFCGARGFNV